MQVTIELPDELVRDPATAGREVFEAALVQAYLDSRLTLRGLGERLGLDVWQAERFLERRHVPLNYTEAELERDRVAFPLPA